MMDFNTFDLHIGPVRINVARYFKVSVAAAWQPSKDVRCRC